MITDRTAVHPSPGQAGNVSAAPPQLSKLEPLVPDCSSELQEFGEFPEALPWG